MFPSHPPTSPCGLSGDARRVTTPREGDVGGNSGRGEHELNPAVEGPWRQEGDTSNGTSPPRFAAVEYQRQLHLLVDALQKRVWEAGEGGKTDGNIEEECDQEGAAAARESRRGRGSASHDFSILSFCDVALHPRPRADAFEIAIQWVYPPLAKVDQILRLTTKSSCAEGLGEGGAFLGEGGTGGQRKADAGALHGTQVATHRVEVFSKLERGRFPAAARFVGELELLLPRVVAVAAAGLLCCGCVAFGRGIVGRFRRRGGLLSWCAASEQNSQRRGGGGGGGRRVGGRGVGEVGGRGEGGKGGGKGQFITHPVALTTPMPHAYAQMTANSSCLKSSWKRRSVRSTRSKLRSVKESLAQGA